MHRLCQPARCDHRQLRQPYIPVRDSQKGLGIQSTWWLWAQASFYIKIWVGDLESSQGFKSLATPICDWMRRTCIGLGIFRAAQAQKPTKRRLLIKDGIRPHAGRTRIVCAISDENLGPRCAITGSGHSLLQKKPVLRGSLCRAAPFKEWQNARKGADSFMQASHNTQLASA